METRFTVVNCSLIYRIKRYNCETNDVFLTFSNGFHSINTETYRLLSFQKGFSGKQEILLSPGNKIFMSEGKMSFFCYCLIIRHPLFSCEAVFPFSQYDEHQIKLLNDEFKKLELRKEVDVERCLSKLLTFFVAQNAAYLLVDFACRRSFRNYSQIKEFFVNQKELLVLGVDLSKSDQFYLKNSHPSYFQWFFRKNKRAILGVLFFLLFVVLVCLPYLIAKMH